MYKYFCLYDCLPQLGLVPEKNLRRVLGALETRVTGGAKLPCQCWEPSLHFLKEKPLLLTAKPSPAQGRKAFLKILPAFVHFGDLGGQKGVSTEAAGTGGWEPVSTDAGN